MKSSYGYAVLDPFNNKAKGARVPDSYAFPTETETFQAKFNVKCNAEFNSDWFDMVFKCSLIDVVTNPTPMGGTMNTSFFVDAKKTSLLVGTPPTNEPVGWDNTWGTLTTNGFIDSNAAGITDNNATGGKFQWTKYRIVGGGVRLKSQLIPDKTTGYLNFYSSPNTKVDYSTPLFKNTDFTLEDNRSLLATHTGRPYVRLETPSTVESSSNQPYAVVLNETMSEEPDGEVVEALQFNAKGCEFAFRPVTSEAYNWINITSAPQYATEFADPNSDGTASTSIATISDPLITRFDESFYSSAGWNNLCVKGSLLPAALGTGATMPIMVVEVIYHVEYISSDIGISNHARHMPYDQGTLDAVAYRASKMPLYRQLYANPDAYSKIKRRQGF